MVRNNEGLTKTYNRFHDPDENDAEILKLRELHDGMDRAVLDAYGWSDIRPTCTFLLDYEEFSPFCKTHTDVKTMRCRLTRSEWQLHNSEKRMIYHISSDRFLRGMVRLIVGMCLNVGLGKINLEDVRQAMDEQKPLKKSWSVPPHGLFLTEVKY